MGRTSAVINASRLRRDSRTHRAIMTGMPASTGDGRAPLRAAGMAITVSDTGDLLLVAAVMLGKGSGLACLLGQVTGKSEEHVVEGGAAHAEPLDRHPAWVERIEQLP